MIKRRHFIKLGAAAGAGFVLPLAIDSSKLKAQMPMSSPTFPGLIDPMLTPKFVKEVPNALAPSFIFDSNKLIQNRRALQIGMYQTQQDLGLVDAMGMPLLTTVWGYGEHFTKATYPGKTIEVRKGNDLKVLWQNNLIDVGGGGFILKTLKYLIGLGTELPHLLPVDDTIHWAYGDVNHHFGTNYSIANDGVPMVPHLHGGHTESDSDGLPDFWFTPYWRVRGPKWVKKWYTYANDQEAGTLWYHDHALGLTRLNVYAGLAGFYILRDNRDTGKVNNPLHLPAYPYEAAFAIQDRCFDDNGQLWIPSLPMDIGEIFEYDPAVVAGLPNPTAAAEFFGDHMLVNGVVWPKMEVEPRKYRFRLLNGSDSRFVILKFANGMTFWQIGTDLGLMDAPVPLTELILAPGERADVIVDFAGKNGAQIVLQNIGPDGPYGGGEPDLDFDTATPMTTGQVMRFDVVKAKNNAIPDNFNVNAPLRQTPFTVNTPVTRVRKLALFEGSDEFGRLQPLLGVVDPNLPTQMGNMMVHMATNGALGWFQNITENPDLNDTEIWEVYNTTMDAHPVHVHLVGFEVLNRQKLGEEGVDWWINTRPQPQHNSMMGDLTTYGEASELVLGANPFGNNPVELPRPNEIGPKDTVHAFPGEVIRFKMKFDLEGTYVWHCHILSHEDHEMMRPYYVGMMPMPGNHPMAMKTDNGFGMQNYPNPFVDWTNIRITLPSPGDIRLDILNMNGQQVGNIAEGFKEAGTHVVPWSGKNENGMPVSEGIYVARLMFNGEVKATVKMVKQTI